jgi:hypothetical protein
VDGAVSPPHSNGGGGGNRRCPGTYRLRGYAPIAHAKDGNGGRRHDLTVHRHPLTLASARALRDLDRFRPHVVPPPYTLGIDWASTSMAESCAMIPGVKRAGSRSVEFTSDDYTQIMSVLGILATIGGSVGCTGAQYG